MLQDNVTDTPTTFIIQQVQMLFGMKYQSTQLDAPLPPTMAHMLLILLRQSVIIEYNLSYMCTGTDYHVLHVH